MALRSTYDGKGYQPGYAGIAAQVFLDVDKANGKQLDPAVGEFYPRLTWGQLVALTQAWKRASARSTVRWPAWYDLTKWGLGWAKEGDRFLMDKERAKATADPATCGLFWREIEKLAETIDASGAKRAPLYVDWTWAGYEAAARDAWHQMKIEREGNSSPPLAPTESSGWGDAVLWIVLLIAAGMAAKKER